MCYIVRVKGKWVNAQDWYYISDTDGNLSTINNKIGATKFNTAAEAFVVAKRIRRPFNTVRVCNYAENSK